MSDFRQKIIIQNTPTELDELRSEVHRAHAEIERLQKAASPKVERLTTDEIRAIRRDNEIRSDNPYAVERAIESAVRKQLGVSDE